jgi:hypothetical protein
MHLEQIEMFLSNKPQLTTKRNYVWLPNTGSEMFGELPQDKE